MDDFWRSLGLEPIPLSLALGRMALFIVGLFVLIGLSAVTRTGIPLGLGFIALALPNVLSGVVPIIGPGIVVIVPIILLLGDINFYRKPQQRSKLRVQRHLARMVWAFVIVLRAPLVEFETAGFYDLPDPLLVAGPVLLGVVMLGYFQRRYGRLRPRSAATAAA